MKNNKYLFTSESVTEGHPDKVCDQIADAILDGIFEKNNKARVACEVCTTTGMILVMGECTDTYGVDIVKKAREVVKDIGYTSSDIGFDYNSCNVLVTMDRQSEDIAIGVQNAQESVSSKDKYDKIGAGDQGMMFGFACNETEQLMPAAIMFSHALTKRLAEVRKKNIIKGLRPDGKAQVTVEYINDKVSRIHTVVLSTQHDPDVDLDKLKEQIKKEIILKVLPKELIDDNIIIHINPTGRFVIGGPMGDSGLTGRKIIVDTYGGYCAHGGGALSGKDPTKVDRSAMYMCRYAAKNVVAAGLADKCQIEIAYAIGIANPVSLTVNTYGTGKVSDEKLVEIVKENFDFRPAAIIDTLNLRNIKYQETSNYGHFGREIFPWEKTDLKAKLEKYKKA